MMMTILQIIAVGGLYQWDEMMQYCAIEGSIGICPDGWHITISDQEWKQLEAVVDSQFGYLDFEWEGNYNRGFNVGLNLKANIGWNPGGNGTDLFGFTALPGGYHYNGNYQYQYYSGNYWTSTEQVLLLR
ncbi:MAG: FISUMP domain-containing protein [Bacteroidales bacterium]